MHCLSTLIDFAFKGPESLDALVDEKDPLPATAESGRHTPLASTPA